MYLAVSSHDVGSNRDSTLFVLCLWTVASLRNISHSIVMQIISRTYIVKLSVIFDMVQIMLLVYWSIMRGIRGDPKPQPNCRNASRNYLSNLD